MKKINEYITNSDGRRSTTAFAQFAGFFILAGILIYAVYLDRSSTSELYFIFASYCGGLVVTKGVVTAYKDRKKQRFDFDKNKEFEDDEFL